ncbi:MAG: AIPR family protein [Dehalococcoidia bacterium]|nr:AIPR family protein [Dehalococcoidia bacterium]
MPDNDRFLLKTILDSQQSERDTPLADSDAFDYFACEQILKRYDLSGDEVAAGIVDGGGDGGIDAIFTFLDESLLVEDAEILSDQAVANATRRGANLELHVLQAKQETGFGETAIQKASSSLELLLDLSLEEEELGELYAPVVIDRMGIFRRALKALAPRYPEIRIDFWYVTQGKTDVVGSTVKLQAERLVSQLQQVATGVEAAVHFVGSSELLALERAKPTYTLTLNFQESATSGASHVALVSLRDYVTFLSDGNGGMRRNVFDWNVRDYQGNVEVNREIRASLEGEGQPEFWWLNNGVTVICSKVSSQSKTYTMEGVQIVNGLQNSYTMHSALKGISEDDPVWERKVLVKILQTEEQEVRDRIIRATNRQTSVPAASLRATEDIQRDIERYFHTQGWYYDRRKNYYRNEGMPMDRIVGISFLAQSVMAMGLSRADSARARPSSLLKSDEEYGRIFHRDTALGVYLWAAKAQKRADAFLLDPSAGSSTQERTDLRFYVSMLAAAKLSGGRVRTPQQLGALVDGDRTIDEADLPECLGIVRATMAEMVNERGEARDKVSKGPDFVDEVLRAGGVNDG